MPFLGAYHLRVRNLFLVVLLAVPARAGFDLESAISELSAPAVAAAKKEKKRKIFPLAPVPALPADFNLPKSLDAKLAELRDKSLAAVSVTIAGVDWHVGATTDAEYDDFHLVLRSAAACMLAPLSPLGRFLDDAGVVVHGEDGPVLRLNARISLLHPINGTSVIAVDAAGGSKKKDSFTVGELVEALKSKGRAFKAGDQELHLFVQPETSADGRKLGEPSIYLARFSGMSSKGWALRESALEPGRPVRVYAAGRILVLLKTTDDRLIVRDAGPAPKR